MPFVRPAFLRATSGMLQLLSIVCFIVPLVIAQYANTQTSSNSEPGYLPDYQGDRYTDQGRISETQALNKPFFDTLGYVPPAPPLTPANGGGSGSAGSGAMPSSAYGYSAAGYGNQQYHPRSSYYNTPSASQQFYNPNTNSDSVTRYYDPVTNTNLGYTEQTQSSQQYTATNPNVQYGYYGTNQMNNQHQQQQQQYGNQQYDDNNYQSWCCGPSSTSCCYQNKNSNPMQYYDPNMSSAQKYINGNTNQPYAYGSSTTTSPYTYTASTTTRSYGKK